MIPIKDNLEIVFCFHNRSISLIQARQIEFKSEFHLTSLNKRNRSIMEMDFSF